MAAMPSTVDVKCPRCDVPIVCTLAVTGSSSAPKPGPKVDLVVSVTVPDLGDKFAEHYAAEHADAIQVAPLLGVNFVEPFTLDSDHFRQIIGLPSRAELDGVVDE
jgi:hypothetical protein